MEEFEVVGVDTQAYRTIQADGGKKVHGVSWMLLGEAPEDAPSGRYIGKYVREQFVSNERLQKLQVEPMPGDKIILIYNRWGDLSRVEVNGTSGKRSYGAGT